MTRQLRTWMLAVLIALPGAAGLVHAQQQPAPRPPGARIPTPSAPPPPSAAAGAGGAGGGATDTKVKIERGAGGKKIYRITEDIRIEGKIQKPEAFFFFQKSSINYDWQELKQDFVPRILETVNRSPF